MFRVWVRTFAGLAMLSSLRATGESSSPRTQFRAKPVIPLELRTPYIVEGRVGQRAKAKFARFAFRPIGAP